MNRPSDQLQNLADALSEDVAAMPPDMLAAEAEQDHGDGGGPASAFDRIMARAGRQARWRRLGQRLRALVPPAAVRSWRPAMAAVAGIAVVVVVGDVYLKGQSDAPSPVSAPVEHLGAREMSHDDATASRRKNYRAAGAGEVPASAPAASPQPPSAPSPPAASADAPPSRPAAPAPNPPPPAPAAKPMRAAPIRPATERPNPPLAQSAAPPMDERSLRVDRPRTDAAAGEPQQSPSLQSEMRVGAAPAPAAIDRAGRDHGAAPSFAWPVHGQVMANLATATADPPDNGIDIAVPVGTDVRAAADGVVVYAGDGIKSFGKLVLVRHDGGFVTAYAHVDGIVVKVDDHVQRGQVLAKSGRAGPASTPLLHFEIRKGEAPVDPRPYLPPG
jgi:murein DD-endopeptidase MepM/ murein hydrolase activator NlpD